MTYSICDYLNMSSVTSNENNKLDDRYTRG